jgi:hypothetical protein
LPSIQHTIRRITRDADWVAPQRRHAARGEDVPSHGSAIGRRAPIAGKGVRFREVMRGVVADPVNGDRRRPVTMRLSVRIDDLRAFLRNPVRPAAIPGTVHVAGMTARPVPVDHGSLHLLAAADGGPRRTMDYPLPFTGDTRQRWWLRAPNTCSGKDSAGPGGRPPSWTLGRGRLFLVFLGEDASLGAASHSRLRLLDPLAHLLGGT